MSQGLLVVPREYGRMISRLSPLSIISGLYALGQGHTLSIAIVPLSIGCTTYLYWHNPTYSWRRNLDMFTVVTCCLYQTYRALDADYTYYYMLFQCMGIFSYLCGMYCYYQRNLTHLGMVYHMGIHILPNIGNIILYSGNIY
jgi:hypothetical protein